MGEVRHERSQSQGPICMPGCARRSWSPCESGLLALPEMVRTVGSGRPLFLLGTSEQWTEVVSEVEA